MSVLLVDIGNTRIKWARLVRGRLGRQRAAAHLEWSARDYRTTLFGKVTDVERILVASVAGARIDRRLAGAARRATGVTPVFVKSVRRAGGVTTRYRDPWRLGVDRFVAVIGAHAMSGGRAACVVDIGTAMTIDLVDGRGVHRGGTIVPGPALMVSSLLRDTSGIGRRARGARGGRALYARNTLAAIEQGALVAAGAMIDRAVADARRTLDAPPRVLVTGGAAPSVRPLVRSAHRLVPDLVLRGLAVLATRTVP
ncbi:MAG: type III pantothenate kinase [Steroidobacteraceae bacterium]